MCIVIVPHRYYKVPIPQNFFQNFIFYIGDILEEGVVFWGNKKPHLY